MRSRLGPTKYDYEVEYQPQTTHKVADRVFRLRRSKEELDASDDEVSCFVTKNNPGGEAVQPDHREAAIAFYGSTEVEAWTEYTIHITVLSAEEEPGTPDPSSMEEFLQAQKEGESR